MGRSTKESEDPRPDGSASYAEAVGVLDEAVRELLLGGWDEPRRQRALEIAQALAEAAREAGWKDAAGFLQAIASLLALPLEEVSTIQDALKEKLFELLDLLREDPLAETA